MRVALIFRQSRDGAHSIETLFSAISTELSTRVDVVEYRLSSGWGVIRDIFKIRALKADIYHITGDVNYVAPLLFGEKVVLTIHDIGHYLYGLTGVKRWLYRWLWLTLPMRMASAITVVSDATREAIVSHFRADRARLRTIQNCYSPKFQPVSRPFTTDPPVVLQVGTKPYKNVPRLVSALRGTGCRLILIGDIDPALQHQLDESGIAYESRSNLTHEEVVQAYRDCDIVSFVSVGEGFGVPIIEAQASGRPLVTSDVAPMNVVAGAGACLVSPTDELAIRNAVMHLIADGAYREQVVQAGLCNAARYSPASVAQSYIDLYEQVRS